MRKLPKPQPLKALRSIKHLTQEQLAHAAGITLLYYRKIEKGPANGGSVPTVKIAKKISKSLGVTVYDILEWEEEEPETL
ncbi:helix-turn-helix transcriptional regulator [Paenibacillus sp. LHD-117]|uniref:helix-turn-helix transcriptional regulator n=1 Tax=Paenibacillus sp. LHD-117 TaxID=3071412 RepID=UPI0027E0A284|nr:helix-turn-helix transcriptional regulator [Paenibacillus sp. LHD-117]MDQ6422589.1 helix-turn-helix transcriptional regulator [Paenibacillus sp. LHD-117]